MSNGAKLGSVARGKSRLIDEFMQDVVEISYRSALHV